MTETRNIVMAATLGAASAGLLAYYIFSTTKEASTTISNNTDELEQVKAELAAAKQELTRANTSAAASDDAATATTMTDSPSSALSLIKPPLPFHVVRLLEASQLCFLSTSTNNDPHLSLMNFTYYQKEEIVIMCTQRDTKKFRQISKVPTVALLIHDFPHLKLDDSSPPENSPSSSGDEKGKTYSITLNGTAEIPQGDYAETLRDIHLKANPDYAGFIQQGSDSTPECPSPAVLVVRIQSARLCNFKDKVEHWDARSAAALSE